MSYNTISSIFSCLPPFLRPDQHCKPPLIHPQQVEGTDKDQITIPPIRKNNKKHLHMMERETAHLLHPELKPCKKIDAGLVCNAPGWNCIYRHALIKLT